MTDVSDLAGLDGLIPDSLGRELFRLAATVPPGRAVVEIGSYRGKSTAYLAAGASPGVPVFAVDPWEMVDVTDWCRHCEQPTREQFERQMAGVGLLDAVTILQGRSVDMAAVYTGPPVGLLYIDGDHHRDAVRADFESWRPHLADAATVTFDDYGVTRNRGVRLAVRDLGLSGGVSVIDGRLAVVTLS